MHKKAVLLGICFLMIIMGFTLSVYGSGNNDGVPGVDDLLNDNLMKGMRGAGSNVVVEPLDPEWSQLKQSRIPLGVGGSYTESFDESTSYFNRGLAASSYGNANVSITSDAAVAVNGSNSLFVDSTAGNFIGALLKNMRVVAGGTYRVEFDYKIIKASSAFYFQFRADSSGTGGDRFVEFSGADGAAGHIDITMELGLYSDYYAMIFAAAPGKISVDNIKITRMNARPLAIDAAITGDLAIDSTITGSYIYLNPDDDVESGTTIKWYAALNRNGLNKTLINGENSSNLHLTSELNGKYIGFEVVPRSMTSKGNRVTVWSDEAVGGVASGVDTKLWLDPGESFTEDFEDDTTAAKNILFINHTLDYSYISAAVDETIDSGNALMLFNDLPPGNLSVAAFPNLGLANNGIYEVSFDYKAVNAPDSLFLVFRSDTAGYSHDKTVQVDTTGAITHFTGEFRLDDYNDYYPMIIMFPSSNGGKVLVDNLRIYRKP
ncbi:hypothetical protein [Paenibacillus sp. PAMC21692]|uniref:hypothetical protein n=1 Tax=Paenibacillus sp. PAMC21692 TaxID=2762320 RepID=UPI00164E55B7|nr:hypothetical protein [Paenibacillus sp. PAMC21692]QNK56675.1 hypothetical protein H7F31_29810 [Paenibacillus sp. PAMC21692]